MALTDENSGMGTTMLVQPSNFGSGMPYPVYMNGQGGGSSYGGNGWDNGLWIILLFILLAGGNWSNQNGANSGFGCGQPIIVNDGGNGGVQRGFDQAAIMSGINGVQGGVQGLSTQLCGCCCDMQNTVNQGFAGVQQSLCSGFAGVNQTVNGAQNAIAQQLYTNQIADLERSYAAQTASTQGMTALQAQLAQCCCDNRSATNDLKYVIATENCADRAAISDGIRDVITNQTANTQRILDQLCSDKIDAKNERIADLERQLTMANLAASQTAQTAAIRAGQVAEIDAMYNRLRDCPVPTMPVYGMQPIFTCPGNNAGYGCGCGGNSFAN